MKIAPSVITQLNPGEIFVYGANEAGIHGAGAARQARTWGAQMGKYGFSGSTYGIPTKDANIDTLPLSRIEYHVNQFVRFAQHSPQYTFLVTPIGCGLAGYRPEDIAPLFRFSVGCDNIYLPKEFAYILEKS